MGCWPSRSENGSKSSSVFGVELARVPKIVVECIKFLERPENISTDGIRHPGARAKSKS